MRALDLLTLANLRSFVRDRAALFWTLAFPVLFVIIFGAIFSGPPTTTSYGYADLDATDSSSRSARSWSRSRPSSSSPAPRRTCSRRCGRATSRR